MSNGFDRLRGVLIASAMGVNVVGAGSARATVTTIRQAILTRGLNISYSLGCRNINHNDIIILPVFGTCM